MNILREQPIAVLSVAALPAFLAMAFATARKPPPTHQFSKYLVTAGSQEEGQKIARELLEKRLIACCNIVPNVKSLYMWKGSIETSAEVLLVMKSKTSLFRPIEQTVRNNHSYEVFELLQVPISDGSAEYLKWIADSTV